MQHIVIRVREVESVSGSLFPAQSQAYIPAAEERLVTLFNLRFDWLKILYDIIIGFKSRHDIAWRFMCPLDRI